MTTKKVPSLGIVSLASALALTACGSKDFEPTTLKGAYNATIPDYSKVKDKVLNEGKINNAATRTTRTTGYGTVISYGKAPSADILKWIEKNPTIPSDSPLSERTLANTAAFPIQRVEMGTTMK